MEAYPDQFLKMQFYTISLSWQGTNLEAIESELIRICACGKFAIYITL